MAIASLDDAKKNKNDEFYTQLSDIENELKHYKEHFKNKIVFCNCDNPRESNFFKYFIRNFNRLGLKKLIITTYINSLIAKGKRNVVYKISINKLEDINDYDLITDEFIDKIIRKLRKKLYGDKKYQAGDFRSAECVELLKQADIIVTNPPFSLFREYVAQLIKYNKKFLIIGNKNSISYKEIFTYIKQNKIWLGFTSPCEFFTIENGQKVKTKKVQGLARWFTNLEHQKRHEKLDLYKKYNPQEYPKYDNYNAINVDKIADIPYDYYEPMGVPITFLDKYNPEQFEILGQMANTTVDEYNFGYPFINGKRKYARIIIKLLGTKRDFWNLVISF